ncbi:MAG: recombination protein NinB [Gammaproteobacteria bacterium]
MKTQRYTVRDGAGAQKAIAAVKTAVLAMDWPIDVKISKHRESRSLKQNSLMWKWNSEIMTHMREHYGQIADAEDWHEVLVSRLQPVETGVIELPDGNVFFLGRTRTSKMTVAEMSDYLNLLEAYCAEHLELILTRPDELYWAALMKEEHIE